MATNVTEKEKTLNEIIEWCDQLSTEIKRTEDATLPTAHMENFAACIWSMSIAVPCSATPGPMPSEVPNQSEE